jgi:hypothetical protein
MTSLKLDRCQSSGCEESAVAGQWLCRECRKAANKRSRARKKTKKRLSSQIKAIQSDMEKILVEMLSLQSKLDKLGELEREQRYTYSYPKLPG